MGLLYSSCSRHGFSCHLCREMFSWGFASRWPSCCLFGPCHHKRSIPMVMIGTCLFCGASNWSMIVASYACLAHFNGQQYIILFAILPICQFVSHNGSLCSHQSVISSVATALVVRGTIAQRHSCALNCWLVSLMMKLWYYVWCCFT
jgi:hypothetical protein